MVEQKVNGRTVLKYLGSIVSFCIGAGFATGQEVMQFFTSYGLFGLAGILISVILYIFMCSSFMVTGQVTKMEHSNDIFKYYCGNMLGTLFEWYSIVLLFLIYIVMVSGAGAVFSDYYQISAIYGRLFMIILSTAAIVIGFKRLINILGSLGPIIVIGCIVVAISAIATNINGFSTAQSFIDNAQLLKASSSWWLSGILYASFMSILLAAFLSAMGATATSKREAIAGGAAGAVSFCIGVLLVTLAQIANIEAIYDKQIPMLHLAKNLIPVIASIFSVILLAGIFTTAAPILWSATIKFAADGTKKFTMIAIALAAVALIVSFLPFGTLVNIVYPSSGWLGIVLLGFMLVKHIRLKGEKTEEKENRPSGHGQT
jgi:uncharacterized membrane protein YkvI